MNITVNDIIVTGNENRHFKDVFKTTSLFPKNGTNQTIFDFLNIFGVTSQKWG